MNEADAKRATQKAQRAQAQAQNSVPQTYVLWMAAANAWKDAGDIDQMEVCILNADACKK
jgi:hypothetical protein